ncbi:alpha/beta fold hydrolase [Amorphoplanes digitatis]|uniref:Pimeloyl-ACP methyl ester carboxylesterase n=1 Tax=Actinoplanes digitatis TaxID=1868 RepID=A0A7W7MUT6_9ACTN|nr:alpha/beta fold hydrolase [Actinoplanes digitatis]MBB4767077.1 pimeloyl-ACP methyl ester carboxylesterase [Actinoplanes digitatis]GID95558.1 hypothetical protein Adi01nite_49700 [Actinoplanes digitatis]
MHPQPPLRTTHVAGNPTAMLMFDRWGQFGRPVLLLHGLLFDRTMWWPAAAALAGPRCTVVAPDLPGHGQSPPRDDCRVEDLAAQLAVLVHQLGLHRAPIVVGHASASRLAAAFAAGHATHDLVTVDEPPVDATDVEDLIAAARPGDVPEHYQPYARPRTDPALLCAYGSWLHQPPARRNQPALAGRAGGRPPAGPFAHLTDPDAFAAQLRELL